MQCKVDCLPFDCMSTTINVYFDYPIVHVAKGTPSDDELKECKKV